MFRVDEIRSSSDCWLGIHEKMTKHAKWRHTHSKNRRKHSPVVPVIASSHAYVPWMCVEQQIALFQHHPWPEENIRPCNKIESESESESETNSLFNSGLGQGEWGLMQAMERGFRGFFFSCCALGLVYKVSHSAFTLCPKAFLTNGSFDAICLCCTALAPIPFLQSFSFPRVL